MRYFPQKYKLPRGGESTWPSRASSLVLKLLLWSMNKAKVTAKLQLANSNNTAKKVQVMRNKSNMMDSWNGGWWPRRNNAENNNLLLDQFNILFCSWSAEFGLSGTRRRGKLSWKESDENSSRYGSAVRSWSDGWRSYSGSVRRRGSCLRNNCSRNRDTWRSSITR